MKKGFVQTENFKRLKEAEKFVARRGAREAGLVIIQGVYGVGKSALTERWAADGNYVFVRAKETWTKRALLDELADKMGILKAGRNHDVQSRIINKMMLDAVPIIVDEADFLVRSTPSLLEVIRDITDSSGTMAFLVGMDQFRYKVAKYPHIASRVAKEVIFEQLNLADVKATVLAKCEVAIKDDVLAELLTQSHGRMRLLLNAIANIEQWAQANDWQSVSAEHIKGKQLCTEFTGQQLGRRKEAL